jgi:starch synthase
MRIVIVTPEAVPFSKTGGLADVAGTLFKEYRGMGLETFLFVPLYKKTKEQFADSIRYSGIEIDIHLGRAVRKCRVFELKGQGVFFVGGGYFDRDELYGTAHGDYPDNDQRFIFFCKAVLEICKTLDMAIDIMHCNDWQTGLIPLYLKTLYKDAPQLGNAKSVITIHNIGYQGVFPLRTMEITGLGWEFFNMECMEFYGNVNFLKAAIAGADIVTTVSKTYAKEILTPEHGFGLDGMLRNKSKSLFGIPNGISYEEWDPSADEFLPKTYKSAALSGKTDCKKELIGKCSLDCDESSPILCFIGRLSGQKGIELLIASAGHFIAKGACVVIIGRGEEHYESALGSLSGRFHGRFFFSADFNEPLAHLAYSGSDIFLMPSRYEPCGLGQMIAMRYGAMPVARRTGGLADTIKDGETGFLFDEYSPHAFADCVDRALRAYRDKKERRRIIKNAMGMDFSWKRSAEAYIRLYSGRAV